MNPNEELFKRILKEIEPIIDEIVFVGGITTFMYLPENTVDLRTTTDVDATVDVGVVKFQQIELTLLNLGFQPDPEVRCRHIKDDLILDLMPADQAILGFSNQWYKAGIEHATKQTIGMYDIKILPIEYFFASKIEAFKGRGNNDFYSSKDMEDIVSVLSGRVGVLDDLENAAADVCNFVRTHFGKFLLTSEFDQTLRGNYPKHSKSSANQFLADLQNFVEEN
jgi:hypothetical protein